MLAPWGAAGCGAPQQRLEHSSTSVSQSAAGRSPAAVDARLREDFYVLRRPRQRIDALPAGIELTRLGADPRSARLAYGLGTSHLYAADAGARLCLLDSRTVVSNCWRKRDALRGEATVAALCARNLPPARIQLAGLVPDGVNRVTVIRPDRRDVTVPVDDNAWLALLPARDPLPLSVRWRRSGRAQRHGSGIPRGSHYEGCGAQDPIEPPASGATGKS